MKVLGYIFVVLLLIGVGAALVYFHVFDIIVEWIKSLTMACNAGKGLLAYLLRL